MAAEGSQGGGAAVEGEPQNPLPELTPASLCSKDQTSNLAFSAAPPASSDADLPTGDPVPEAEGVHSHIRVFPHGSIDQTQGLVGQVLDGC